MGSSDTQPLNTIRLPLSLSQHEVWLDQRAWPDSVHLNIGGGSYLTGPIDADLLLTALKQLVANNDALRMAPYAQGGQVLLAHWEPAFETVDFRGSKHPREDMQLWWNKRITDPFLLDGRPPWRMAFLQGPDHLNGLYIQFHHLVMDGWGTALIMRHWSAVYNQLALGQQAHIGHLVHPLGVHAAFEPSGLMPIEPSRPVPLTVSAPVPLDGLAKPAPPSYASYVDDSNIYRSSPGFERDAIYWQTQHPELEAPLFDRRYAVADAKSLPTARTVKQTISRASYDALNQRATELGHTPFSYFLAAMVLYFARVCHRQDIVVGVPSLNRGGKRFKETLGMFVGVLPVKVHVDLGMQVHELIAAVNTAMRGALRHPRYPLSELGRSLNMIRQKRDGLFDVLLSFERQDYALNFGSAQLLESRQLFSGISRFPLGVTVCEFDAQSDLELALEGSSACFAEEEVDLLGRRLSHIVEALASAPNACVSDVPIVPPEELWALTQGLHGDVASQTSSTSFITLFEHQAALRPEAVALVWNEGSVDYAGLDARANHLAQQLVDLGAGAGKVVAIAIARAPEMVLALLAVAKSGAAFLPLDAEAPQERLRGILGQSNAIVLLVHGADSMGLSALHAHCIALNWATTSLQVARVKTPAPELSDLAYLMFTSGSTGQPKGVTVTHGALALRLAWLSRAYAMDWRDRSAQATQFTFDPSLIELCLPLIHGASVALPPPGRLLPESLVEFAVRHGVTVMAFVPSTLARFLSAAEPGCGLKLRVACCGGEVLSPDLANRFLRETGARLFNVYGPTETTIFATAWECEPRPSHATLPIGRPIDDTRIYVLSPQLQLLPFGVAGEVFIGGGAVAQGYLNRPDLNALAFLPDPFVAGGRMYRTGDRGWLGSEGNLYFVGRLDRQVKLRGYRIELGEIESQLLGITGVRQAAAKLVQRNGKPMICAWVNLQDASLQVETLQRALRSRLPDYMVPSAIMTVSNWPTNATGKTNYDALLENALPDTHAAARAPRGALEIGLVALWREVLDAKTIHVTDNFFDLGGDSLAVVHVLTGIEKLVGKKVTMQLVTEHPTIERLAQALVENQGTPGMMIRLSAHNGPTALYIAASGHGDLIRFQNLARSLGEDFQVHMLQPALGQPIGSVMELASQYADCIERHAQGPALVAGFSVGGVAALETTRVLLKRSTPARGLVLIETIYPKAMFGGTTSWRLLGWLVRNLHVQDLSMNGRRLGAMFNDPALVGQVMALTGYRPQELYAPTLLIKSSGLASWDRLLFRAWRRLVSPLNTQQVTGLHGSIFETGNVGDLAAVIRQYASDLPALAAPGGP